MTTLTSALVESIRQQDKVFYHENCFATWDGEVTQEVIEQGILDRLKTMERFEDLELGVRISRVGVTQYNIAIADMNSESIVLKFSIFTGIRSIVGMDGYFNVEEERTLLDFFTNDIH